VVPAVSRVRYGAGMNRTLDVATSLLASAARLGAGMSASKAVSKRPEKLLEIYEFEACPFCRKVREALSNFDLDAMIYPCPKGGRFRSVVVEKGGKSMYPFLVDPNTGTSMYESSDIIRYLANTYGDGSVPVLLSLGPLTTMSSGLASLARPTKGRMARPARAPERPLELWSFEASPYCRIVREELCELEIPYHLHNVAKNGAGRSAFKERSGRMMVPYLVDPNTDTAMFESADIVAYLRRTYAG
jgi:glutathione S-transferase